MRLTKPELECVERYDKRLERRLLRAIRDGVKLRLLGSESSWWTANPGLSRWLEEIEVGEGCEGSWESEEG